MKSNIAFKGRDAVKAQRAGGVKKIMATFTCDGDVILSGRETIYRNGKRCGWLSSAGYGHTVGKSIGMGYVRSGDVLSKEHVMSGEYELEVATVRIKAQVALAALHDPKMVKVRG
jgi:4-methylaminobutanoate oxidase (formaldehyde-forming)